MSDSQSSVGSVRRGRHCFCGERAIILTSRTQENPGRRFWRCKNFKSADDCDFFDWIDLPSTDAKDIAIGRLRVKISILNGTVRRLHMVNKALLVSTLILVAAVCILLFLVVKHKFEE
ncbi:uncharacterized protein G2W53_022242 [Senna tora]|uniref:GRF-type domain-containing protein n=1 Tax=Senna tora TaxID=362788 RepID=A0A834TKW2_9FABA|nr:uncharacterized protein G2W53_022242 [Senna tora]